MKRTPCLARVLVLALLLGGLMLPETRQDAGPGAKERAQYKPAAVVPALGLRG